jgi:hypothetical protein
MFIRDNNIQLLQNNAQPSPAGLWIRNNYYIPVGAEIPMVFLFDAVLNVCKK